MDVAEELARQCLDRLGCGIIHDVDVESRRELGVDAGVDGTVVRLGPAADFYIIVVLPAQAEAFFAGARPERYYRFFAEKGQWLKPILAELQPQRCDLGGEFVGTIRLCDSHFAISRAAQILLLTRRGARFNLSTG